MAVEQFGEQGLELALFRGVQAATPEAALVVWSAPEGVETGIWEATPGRFGATRDGYHEVCQILSGRATLAPTGGEPVQIGPGDTLVTPAGWTGVWEVHETLRKTYVVLDA